MRETNLKAVTNTKPEQLSFEEARQLAKSITNAVCQDDDAVEMLLLFAVQMMEHCNDHLYIDTLAMELAQHLTTLHRH